MQDQSKEHDTAHEKMVEEFWRTWAHSGPPLRKVGQQKLFRFLPSEKRCKFCFAPFDGTSGSLLKNVLRIYPSRYNPHYCNVCDDFAKKFQGGAEVPMAMMFADIRGSTKLAEKIGSKDFSELINRFYVTSTEVLAAGGAMIEKLVGDEVTALFVPGIAGQEYQKSAITAARQLLAATGHQAPDGPWAPIGIGIHSGDAFIGSVGTPDGMMEVAALGDVPNTASRLAASSKTGEILVSQDTMDATGLDSSGFERRVLELKGKDQTIEALVLGL